MNKKKITYFKTKIKKIVKPKNFKVMKKRIFTLVMMLALVVVAGSAMAQSTPRDPYIGTEESYQWSGVTASSYYYTVSTSDTDPAAAATNTHYNVTGSTTLNPTGSASGTTTAVNITWSSLSNNGNYYVWLVASNGTCNNYRYVHVRPVSRVNFKLLALGLGDDSPVIADLDDAADVDGGANCPTERFGTTFETANPNVSDDGAIYAYFRVDRENSTGDSWQFTLSVTGVSGSVISVYNSATSSWSTASASSLAVTALATDNYKLIRVLVDPLPTSTATTISGSISAAMESTTLLADYITTAADNDANYSVNPIPAIGDFVE